MASTDQKTIEILVELVDKLSRPLGEIQGAIKGLEQSIKAGGGFLDQFNADVLDLGSSSLLTARAIKSLGSSLSNEIPKLQAFAEGTNAVARSLNNLSKFQGFKLARVDVPNAREIPAVKAATSAGGIKNLGEQSERADESLRKVTEAFNMLERAESAFFVINSRVVTSFKELVAPLKELEAVSTSTAAALAGSIRMLGVLDRAATSSGMSFANPLQALRNLRESVSSTADSVHKSSSKMSEGFDQVGQAMAGMKMYPGDNAWLHMMGGLSNPVHAKTVTTVKQINEESSVLSNTIERLSQRFLGMGRDSQTALGGTLRAFHDLEVTLSRFNSGAITMGIGLTAFGASLVQPFRMAVEIAAQLETEMDRVGAVTNATTLQLRELTKAANDLGKSSPFSAQQVAEGMRELALAGYDVTQILKAMPTVTNMAAAGFMSIKDAASITSGIMKGFGLPVEELSSSVDTITLASNQSNASIEELGVAFHYAGSIAKTAGSSFADTTAALAKLHDAGFKGSLAGTSLRGVFDSLLNPTKQQAELIAKLGERLGGLGLMTDKATGGFVKMSDLLRQFEDAGVTSGEILELFGQRAGPGMAALLQLGSTEMAKFESQMTGAAGATQRMADAMRDNLQGSFENLKSSLEAFGATIGDKFIGAFKILTDGVVSLVNGINGLAEKFPMLTAAIAYSIGAFAALALAMGGMMFAWFMFGVGASKGILVMKQFGSLVKQLSSDIINHGIGITYLGNTHKIAGEQVGALASIFGTYSASALEAAQASGVMSTAEKELLNNFVKEKEAILQNIAALKAKSAAATDAANTKIPELEIQKTAANEKYLLQLKEIEAQKEKIAATEVKLAAAENSRSRGGFASALTKQKAALVQMEVAAYDTYQAINNIATSIDQIGETAKAASEELGNAQLKYADDVAVAYNKMRIAAQEYGLQLEKLVTQEELEASQDMSNKGYDPNVAFATKAAFLRQQSGIFQDTTGNIESLNAQMAKLVGTYGAASDAALKLAVANGKITQQEMALVKLGRSPVGIQQLQAGNANDIMAAQSIVASLKNQYVDLNAEVTKYRVEWRNARAIGDTVGAAKALQSMREAGIAARGIATELRQAQGVEDILIGQTKLLQQAFVDANNADLAGLERRIAAYHQMAVAAEAVEAIQIVDAAGAPIRRETITAKVKPLVDDAEAKAAGALAGRGIVGGLKDWFTRAAPAAPGPGIAGFVTAAKQGIRPLFGWITKGLMSAVSFVGWAMLAYDIGKMIYEAFNKPIDEVANEAKKKKEEIQSTFATLEKANLVLQVNSPDSEEFKQAADELARALPDLKFDMNIDPFTGKVTRVIRDLDQIEERMNKLKEDANIQASIELDANFVQMEEAKKKIDEIKNKMEASKKSYNFDIKLAQQDPRLFGSVENVSQKFAEKMKNLGNELYSAEKNMESLNEVNLKYVETALEAGLSVKEFSDQLRKYNVSPGASEKVLNIFKEQVRVMQEMENATTKTGKSTRIYLSNVEDALKSMQAVSEKASDKLRQLNGEVESLRQRMAQDIKFTFDLDKSLLSNTLEQIDLLPDLFANARKEVGLLASDFKKIGQIDPLQLQADLQVPKTDNFKSALQDIYNIFERLGERAPVLGYQIDSIADSNKWSAYRKQLEGVVGAYYVLGRSGELAGKWVYGTTETLAQQADQVAIKYRQNDGVIRQFTGTLQDLQAKWKDVAVATSGPKTGQDLLKNVKIDSNAAKQFPILINNFTESLTLLQIQAKKSESSINAFVESSVASYNRAAEEERRGLDDVMRSVEDSSKKKEILQQAEADISRRTARGIKEANFEADTARLESRKKLLSTLNSLEDQYKKQQQDLIDLSIDAARAVQDSINAQKGKPTSEFEQTKRQVEDVIRLTERLNKAMAMGDVAGAKDLYPNVNKLLQDLSALQGAGGANSATKRAIQDAQNAIATFSEFSKMNGNESGKAAEQASKMAQQVRGEVTSLELSLANVNKELRDFKIGKDFEDSLKNLVDKLQEVVRLMLLAKDTSNAISGLTGMEKSMTGLANAQEVLTDYKNIIDLIKQYQALEKATDKGSTANISAKLNLETRIKGLMGALREAVKKIDPESPILSLPIDASSFKDFEEKGKASIESVRKYAMDQQIDVVGKLMSMQLDPDVFKDVAKIEETAKALGVESKIKINADDAISTFNKMKKSVVEYLDSFSQGEKANQDFTDLANRMASTLPAAMKSGFKKAFETIGDTATAGELESAGRDQAERLSAEFEKLLGPKYASIFKKALDEVNSIAQSESIKFKQATIEAPKIEAPTEAPVIPSPAPVTAPITPKVEESSAATANQQLDSVAKKERTAKIVADAPPASREAVSQFFDSIEQDATNSTVAIKDLLVKGYKEGLSALPRDAGIAQLKASGEASAIAYAAAIRSSLPPELRNILDTYTNQIVGSQAGVFAGLADKYKASIKVPELSNEIEKKASAQPVNLEIPANVKVVPKEVNTPPPEIQKKVETFNRELEVLTKVALDETSLQQVRAKAEQFIKDLEASLPTIKLKVESSDSTAKAQAAPTAAAPPIVQKVEVLADDTQFQDILKRLKDYAMVEGEAAARSLLGRFTTELNLGSSQVQQAGEAISGAVAESLKNDTETANAARNYGAGFALQFVEGIKNKYDPATFSTLVKQSFSGLDFGALVGEQTTALNKLVNSFGEGANQLAEKYQGVSKHLLKASEDAKKAKTDLELKISASGQNPTAEQVKSLSVLTVAYQESIKDVEAYWEKSKTEIEDFRTKMLVTVGEASKLAEIFTAAGGADVAPNLPNYEGQIKALETVITKFNEVETAMDASIGKPINLDGVSQFSQVVEQSQQQLVSLGEVIASPKVDIQGVEDSISGLNWLSEILGSFTTYSIPIEVTATGTDTVLNSLKEVKEVLDYLVSKTWTIKTTVSKSGMGFNTGGLVPGYATGGPVYKFASGGSVFKKLASPFVPGTGNRDTVPAMLTPGEFVIDKITAARLGLDFLQSLKSLQFFSSGGLIKQSGTAYSPVKSMTQQQLNERAPHSGKEDTVNVKLNVGGKDYPLRGPRDTVKSLVSALNHVNSK